MPPPSPARTDNARAGRAAIAILGLIALVLIAYLIVGFDPVILYGLLGGLVGCLIVVGLDRLRALQVQPPAAASPEGERDDAPPAP